MGSSFHSNGWAVALGLFVALGAGSPGLAESARPVAVSPGSSSGTVIGETCPTFSWRTAGEAEAYEMVIYRVEAETDETNPVLRQRLSGSGWTPSLDLCLERGGTYAWSVRALGPEESSEWSVPSLFEVAPGPDEAEFEAALEVVRGYLGRQAMESEGAFAGAEGARRLSSTAVPGLAGESAMGPSALSPAWGDPALLVNGSPVITAASLTGALCSSLAYRYMDQGDGTVLDCNTGLLWLKQADCSTSVQWAAAESWVSTVENGMCGLTDGSAPGDWRQPTVSELCSDWSGSNVVPCPDTAASDSLLDLAVGPPYVVNAKGDGAWSEGDAFEGVPVGMLVWSGTVVAGDSSKAWGITLTDAVVGSPSKLGFGFSWPVRSAP